MRGFQLPRIALQTVCERSGHDAYILQNTSPVVLRWVQACRAANPHVERGDSVDCRLELPQPVTGTCTALGLYQVGDIGDDLPISSSGEIERIADLAVESELSMSSFDHPAGGRPASAWSVSDVEEFWNMSEYCKNSAS